MTHTFREMSNNQLIERAPSIGAQKPHHAVSERYSFVPTIQVVDLLRDSGWLPVMARESRANLPERNGFQQHEIRFSRTDLVLSNQERVDLVLHNSHDRGTAFKLAASVWRQVCSNGLMIANEFLSFRHKHIGFDPSEFILSAQKISNSAGLISDKVDELKVIELTPDERGIYANASLELIYEDDAPIQAAQLLQERRFDDKGNNLWNTFNVVQENMIKGGLHGGRKDKNGKWRASTTREVKSIDKDRRLNEALWHLTEAMAEIKNAA